MKKLVRIICIVFAVLMVAALPLSAAKSAIRWTFNKTGRQMPPGQALFGVYRNCVVFHRNVDRFHVHR